MFILSDNANFKVVDLLKVDFFKSSFITINYLKYRNIMKINTLSLSGIITLIKQDKKYLLI